MLALPRLPAHAVLAARIRCAARSCGSSTLRPRTTAPAFSTAPRSRCVTELDIPCSRGVLTMRDFRRRHSIPIALVCLTLVGVGGLTGSHVGGARALGTEEAPPKPALQA